MNIDHYEAVGILKAAGSTIALRVVRDYSEKSFGDTCSNEPEIGSKSLSPPNMVTKNCNIPPPLENNVQMFREIEQNSTLPYSAQTNGLAQVKS